VLDEPFNAIDDQSRLFAFGQHWHMKSARSRRATRSVFPFSGNLLLARGPVAWGPTAEVLTSENLTEARRMCEAFDDSAPACAVDDLPSRAA
jgi:zinc/manganese transport system ATP-binding protein